MQRPGSSSTPVTLISGAGVGILAAAISLARVLLSNPDALSTLVWAEDGIFPLCVDKVGSLSCLFDPYAGYLLFTPRVIAIPISWLPLESWALATNLAAAVLAGLLSAIVFIAVKRWGAGTISALVISLIPVGAPIVGLEAINVYSSGYMLLLFTMVLVLTTWTETRNVWWVAFGLVVTALTIPTAIVLVIPLILVVVRTRISIRDFLILLAALIIGLAVQFGIALSAANPRPMNLSLDSLNSWIENMPVAMLTLWPGLSFGPTTVFGIFELPVQTWTGWIVVLVALLGGIYLLISSDNVRSVIGVLLLSGLAAGAIPTVIGYVNNRYYVVPVLLWAAAGVIGLAQIRWRQPLVMGVLGIVLLAVLWWPAFPASAWRAGASPSWVDEVNRINQICAADIAANVDVVFSPDWPMPQVEVTEPTTGNAKCVEVTSR